MECDLGERERDLDLEWDTLLDPRLPAGDRDLDRETDREGDLLLSFPAGLLPSRGDDLELPDEADLEDLVDDDADDRLEAEELRLEADLLRALRLLDLVLRLAWGSGIFPPRPSLRSPPPPLSRLSIRSRLRDLDRGILVSKGGTIDSCEKRYYG